MFKRVLFILICLCPVAPAFAAEDNIITNHPPKTGEQVFILPQDENMLYLTVYGDPADARYAQLRKWFNENPELKAIRAKVHYAAIDTNSKLFKERYADEVTSSLCLRIVTPGGIEIMNLDASQLPLSDKALNNGVRAGLIDKLFGGRQKQQQKQSPQDRMKQKIDDKIDEKIDNANLPPVTSYVMSRIAKALVGGIFTVIIVIALVLAAFKVIREVREASQQ